MATAMLDTRNDDAALSLLCHFPLSPELSGTACLLKSDPAFSKPSETGMMNFWQKLGCGQFHCYWDCFWKALFTMGEVSPAKEKKLGDKLVVSQFCLVAKVLVAVSRTLSRSALLKYILQHQCSWHPLPQRHHHAELLSFAQGSISWPTWIAAGRVQPWLAARVQPSCGDGGGNTPCTQRNGYHLSVFDKQWWVYLNQTLSSHFRNEEFRSSRMQSLKKSCCVACFSYQAVHPVPPA